MKPLVSIVIPVYNTEKYVGECLDSLINQIYQEIEIICVDDGSTDSSREIILEYAEKDARVQLVTQEHSNAGAARNKGLGIATGEYIAFLDSDDFFQTDLIEKMVEKAVRTQANCVICRNIYYDNEEGTYSDQGLIGFQNAQIPDWNNFSKDAIPDSIFQLTMWAWDKLYKLSFIRENHLLFQEQARNNDILFVLKSYILAERMAICSDAAITYRINNPESLRGSWGCKWHCLFRAFEELRAWLEEQGVLGQVERSFVKNAASNLIFWMDQLTDEKLYFAFFDYFKHEGIKKLGLLPHDESYYHDQDIHEKLEYISTHSGYEYLFYQKNYLVALDGKRVDRIRYLMNRIRYLVTRIDDLRETITAARETIRSKHWRFRESRLPNGSRVVIYGYGDVGHDLAEQIADSSRLRLEAVVDSNFERFGDEPVKVRPVQEICQMVFDYCIIAVWDKKAVEEIRSILIDSGICQDKIIWFEIESEDNYQDKVNGDAG